MTEVGNAFGTVVYHHVHIYAKSLESLEHYKTFEKQNTSFLRGLSNTSTEAEGRALYSKITGVSEISPYSSQNQDIVEQLIWGTGWRVTAAHQGSETQSVVIASEDPNGARFIVTAPTGPRGSKKQKTEEKNDHFRVSHLERFLGSHANRAGMAVLGFRAATGSLQLIHDRYKNKHPKLLVHPEGVLSYSREDGATFSVLEVFAYYSAKTPTEADIGTCLRIVEYTGEWSVLPGLENQTAEYVSRGSLSSAYFDHWVSNVVNRQQFLATLHDTLGFTSKVDFNAGVVAAGEAIIESTVTGNAPSVVITSKEMGLRNQEQVYLPINNAISTAGHVHLFLEEMGQGIQHLASRVEDLVELVDKANFYRACTGRGLSFLNIPPSYYGALTVAALTSTGVSSACAEAIWDALISVGLMNKVGILNPEISAAEIEALGPKLGGHAESFSKHQTSLIPTIRRGVYSNLYSLLRDHLTEATYLKIVRNKILVDIQGKDVLYQIFTANVLQESKTEEAPFLEFIQRVCSEQKDSCGQAIPIRPGCGGFGIRNFLTLFLSIEVSKAMNEFETASEKENKQAQGFARRKIDILTNQLSESNPILTDIADAMTAEAEARAELVGAQDDRKAQLLELVARHEATKLQGNRNLMEVSDRYKAAMAAVREEQTKHAADTR